MTSLSEIAEGKVFQELTRLVASESAKSIFAVGGTIPVTALDHGLVCDTDEAFSDSDESGNDGMKGIGVASTSLTTTAVHKMRCDPVTVRWDSEANTTAKITFPCSDVEGPNLEQLLKDCQPATFGRGGQDVMDETYRKAGKLDETAFSSNFNPYALGIVDTAAKFLVPNMCQQTNQTHGVRAELYKLNVYSAPSGKFKAHVDTPRSKHQVGSLVVCLPSVHEGGQLILRHQGREQVFDWSGEEGGKAVQWAAFYSDCEHEVLQVTSGHRITLTYNLYATCRANTAFIDPKQTELFHTLQTLLKQASFCKDGLVLGYHCAHAYPHTEEETIGALPATLKGVDKLVYECFFATTLDVSLSHKLNVGKLQDDELEYEGLTDLGIFLGPSDSHHIEAVEQKLQNAYELIEKQGFYGDMVKKWMRKAEHKRRGDLAVLSNGLVPFCVTDNGLYGHLSVRNIAENWSGFFAVDFVKWLNSPSHEQPALVHPAYGNELEMVTKYANMVILMRVPPFQQR